MKFSVRRLALSIPLAAMMFLPAATAAPTPADGPATPVQQELTATGAQHQVRLRKLHMVRPDLIPYPLAIEIYC